ncbi:MAG: xanthine dehydrogenase family protein subunit M [Candidatus Latescibacteria bacterium]|nr:xanthine dehydrogenase family protein subunit M [Candidatus Latescibacterota bacterium]
MKAFDYFAPETIKEAIEILTAHPKAMMMAGGTDSLVRMKGRVWTPSAIVDVRNLPGVRDLAFKVKQGLTIGPGVTMQQAALSDVVQKRFAAVAQGASVVGSIQIRNLATVAGNVCNAAPSADTAPGLIALGAKVKIAGPKGRRTMSVENFMTGPGQTALTSGELVTSIQVPTPPARTGSAYVRHTPRLAMDIAVVGVGAAVTLAPRSNVCKDVKIVLGAVAPTPIRAKKAERILKGKELTPEIIASAAEVAAGEARPITDVRTSADFRREMVRVLTERMVQAAQENAKTPVNSKRRAA